MFKNDFFSPSLLEAQRDFHYESLVTPGGKSHENVKPSGFLLEFLTLEFVPINLHQLIITDKIFQPQAWFPQWSQLLVFCLESCGSLQQLSVSPVWGEWFALWTQFSDMSKWVFDLQVVQPFLAMKTRLMACPALVTGCLREVRGEVEYSMILLQIHWITF